MLDLLVYIENQSLFDLKGAQDEKVPQFSCRCCDGRPGRGNPGTLISTIFSALQAELEQAASDKKIELEKYLETLKQPGAGVTLEE